MTLRRFSSAASILLALGALPTLGACKKHASVEGAPPPPSTPVAPPEGLVAEVVVRAPDAFWDKLHTGVSGPLARFPQSASGVIAALSNLDLTLAGEIDGAAPAYGVAAVSGPYVAWAAAMKLRDFGHAKAALISGKGAPFTAHPSDDGVIVLTSTRVQPPATAGGHPSVIALSPLGYAVLAKSEADLVTLAPYATRTMPSRPLPQHGADITINHAALAGALVTKIRGSWATARAVAEKLDTGLRQEHGGRSPDFGDPKAVLDAVDGWVQGKLALIGDFQSAEILLDTTDDALDAELRLSPGPGPSAKALKGLTTATAAPLLTLSASSAAALLTNDNLADIRANAKPASDQAAKVLSPMLKSDKDVTSFAGALQRWADARGPWLAIGVEAAPIMAVTLRTPSEQGGDKAVEGFVDLLRQPPLRRLLEQKFTVTGVSTASALAGEGATEVATFHLKKGPPSGEVALAWGVSQGLLRVAAAASTPEALAESKQATDVLGGDPKLAAKLGALLDRSSVVFVLRPDATKAPERAVPSGVLAWGKDKEVGWATAKVDDELVRKALETELGP